MKIPEIKNVYKMPESIRALLREAAEKNGDKIVYKYFTAPNEVSEMSYKQLYANFKYVGAAICSLDLNNKRIAIIGDNSPMWMISLMSVISTGSVAVPLDKELLPAQIENFLSMSEADAVFCSGKFVEKISAMNLPNLKFIVDFDNKGNSDKRYYSFEKLLTIGGKLIGGGDKRFKRCRYDRSKMSLLIFTSGTTGTSKGVMLSEDNVLTALTAASNMINLKSNNVLLSVLPMHHTYEMTAGQLTAFRLGLTICINNSLKYVMRNMKMFQPSAMVVVPLYVNTIKKKISDEIRNRNKQKIVDVGIKASKALRKVGIDTRSVIFSEVLSALGGKLKTMICGGAATDPEAIKWFENLGINVYQGYGITECSPLVAVNPLVNVNYNSVGLPIPGSRVKIISDETGREVDLQYGEIGEICVKGGHVMLGYYNNEEATKAAFTQEGYFRTGDFGYMDRNNYIYITGRKKNIIILDNGKNVYPEEIEEYLERIDSIKESVVIGRENASGEVVITALIYPDYDLFKDCSEEQISEKMRAEVANINKMLPTFKQIRNIEIKKNEFEKTTTRKIIRYKLS